MSTIVFLLSNDFSTLNPSSKHKGIIIRAILSQYQNHQKLLWSLRIYCSRVCSSVFEWRSDCVKISAVCFTIFRSLLLCFLLIFWTCSFILCGLVVLQLWTWSKEVFNLWPMAYLSLNFTSYLPYENNNMPGKILIEKWYLNHSIEPQLFKTCISCKF